LLVDLSRGGPWSHQAVEISRFELVGVLGQCRQIADSEITGPRAKNAAEGQGAQRGVTASTSPMDQQSVRIGSWRGDEVVGRVDAIIEVDDAPGTLQPLTVRATVADTSAVVDVDDGEATTGPVLGVVTQRRTGAYRGATVAGHNQRRRFALGAFKILI